MAAQRNPTAQEYRQALADLSDGALSFLRADLGGLSALISAREKAEALLGRDPGRGRSCTCRPVTGFHEPGCAQAKTR